MPKAKKQNIVMNDTKGQVKQGSTNVSKTYRQEILKTIDEYQDRIKNQKMDRKKIHNRLRLLQMRDQINGNGSPADIEKQLRSMSVDIEDPTLRMQRNISVVIIAYTLFAIFSFVILTTTDRILLPGFNIPYSVLLMGLIGSLVSMFVKLPNIRVREPLSYDTTIWFVINPFVAVIMAGIFFGIAQILLPLLPFELLDESWPYWILAWVVGFINWIYCYEKFSNSGRKGNTKQSIEADDHVQVINRGNPPKRGKQ
jgi:hypothetical protein